MENEQNKSQEQPSGQHTPQQQKLPPGLEAIVTDHLAAHPTLTREEVLKEIRAVGF